MYVQQHITAITERHMKFTDYSIASDIKENLNKFGFKRPTDIQFKAMPPIMRGEDVLAIAQTGTGKTAAFAIPVINNLHTRKRSKRSNGIRSVVMVPTRELALQIYEVFRTLCTNTRVTPFCIFGGVEQDAQIAKLQKGIDILIATPGRLFDLSSQGYIDLSQIEILILDEADHMLDLGFIKDIRDLIKYLPRKRQTLFFSATIDKEIKKLAYSLVHNPIRIEISPKDPVSKNIEHSMAYIEMDDKRFFLRHIISTKPQSKILVFVRTKVRAERVLKALERANIKATTIHGDKNQKDRLTSINEFKEGTTKVLIATDVSARGIDIPGVEYVVNYDLPEQTENYVHRIGRTGRAKNRGYAISFCSSEEKELLEKIELYIGKKITELEINNKEYKDIISFKEEPQDWKSLMDEAEKEVLPQKKRKGKKRNR